MDDGDRLFTHAVTKDSLKSTDKRRALETEAQRVKNWLKSIILNPAQPNLIFSNLILVNWNVLYIKTQLKKIFMETIY